jgi:O-antigen/teichoic acid export membrane protein
MLVHGRLRQDMWIVVTATLLNVVLNIVLIPRHGIAGAAVATLVAEALNLLLGYAMAVRLGMPFRVRPYTRSMAAAAVMAVVLVLVGASLHVFVRIALGGVTYVAALALFRGVPEDARPHLRALLGRLHRG